MAFFWHIALTGGFVLVGFVLRMLLAIKFAKRLALTALVYRKIP